MALGAQAAQADEAPMRVRIAPSTRLFGWAVQGQRTRSTYREGPNDGGAS
jgi:hypothetical protein